VADRSVSVPMTVTDLEKREVKGQNFLADLHVGQHQTVWPRMTEFDMVTQVGEAHFYGSAASIRGRAPASPNF